MSSPTFGTNLFHQLNRLGAHVRDATIRAEERAKATHERFNVFTTLLSAQDEVRLHTRFLHCLLDPTGSHDCGALFLELFFTTLAETPGKDHHGNAKLFALPASFPRPWKVSKEAARMDHGRIDLLLENAGFGIAMENKIYAAEQASQLSGYAAYLRSQYGYRRQLIFLTLDGKGSATHGDEPYLRISYAEHILAWLERCLQATYQFVPINQALLQYRVVVRRLVGQTLESKTMKEIIECIARNPDLIRHREIIVQALEGLRADFLERLATRLADALKGLGYSVDYRDGLRDPEGAFIVRPVAGSILTETGLSFWVENISGAPWRTIAVGLKAPDGCGVLSEGIRRRLIRANRLLNEDAAIREARQSKPNDAWPTGWHRLLHPFEDEMIAKHFGTEGESALVANLSDQVVDHMRRVESAYAKADQTAGA